MSVYILMVKSPRKSFGINSRNDNNQNISLVKVLKILIAEWKNSVEQFCSDEMGVV